MGEVTPGASDHVGLGIPVRWRADDAAIGADQIRHREE